jgi:hypothetical protein
MPRGSGSVPHTKVGEKADLTALTHTATLVFSGKCSLSSFFIYNACDAAMYLQFYDAAAAATFGDSTTPDFQFGVPTVNYAQMSFVKPIQFTNGMVVRLATAATGHTAGSSTATVSLQLGD